MLMGHNWTFDLSPQTRSSKSLPHLRKWHSLFSQLLTSPDCSPPFLFPSQPHFIHQHVTLVLTCKAHLGPDHCSAPPLRRSWSKPLACSSDERSPRPSRFHTMAGVEPLSSYRPCRPSAQKPPVAHQGATQRPFTYRALLESGPLCRCHFYPLAPSLTLL